MVERALSHRALLDFSMFAGRLFCGSVRCRDPGSRERNRRLGADGGVSIRHRWCCCDTFKVLGHNVRFSRYFELDDGGNITSHVHPSASQQICITGRIVICPSGKLHSRLLVVPQRYLSSLNIWAARPSIDIVRDVHDRLPQILVCKLQRCMVL